MAGVITIELKGLHFFASHGMHAEEQKIGNEFDVNVELKYVPGEMISSIDQTINYVEVYNVVKQEFSVHRDLLEQLAMQIAENLKNKFDSLQHICISIQKISPPIANFSGGVGVKYERSFK